MKIRYRITFRDSESPELMKILEQHKFKYKRIAMPGEVDAFIAFDVHDDHVAWERISDLVKRHNMGALPLNIFSKEEILEAPWCRVQLVNPVGYPQPENKWLSTHFTYAGFDAKSGIFSHQIEPFRIKREPALKYKQFMTLFWTSELFAKKEVIEKFEKAGLQGFEVSDVIINSSGRPSEVISQIVIPKITEAHALLANHPLSKTDNDVVKYLPHTRGMLPYSRALLQETADFALSKEWFGDGGVAYREILVSQRVSHLFLENGWSGIFLEPLQIDS